MTTLAVLGAGSAGTALAQVAAGNGHSVRLWSTETAVLGEIRAQRTNSKYLPDVSLHEGIAACWGLADALAGAEIAIVSVPTHAVRAVVREAAPYLTGGPVVHNVAKGLEEGTDLRMSEVMGQVLTPQNIEKEENDYIIRREFSFFSESSKNKRHRIQNVVVNG